MVYIKPYPNGMSLGTVLNELSKLNSLGADYEVSEFNEIMVSVKCLIKPETSIILAPNVFYDLFNKNGAHIAGYEVCLSYDRKFLRFYINGSVILDVDYQVNSNYIYPKGRKLEIIEKLSQDFFDNPRFLSL